tara:strand:+ start:7436 stop:7954 length:519 start_codon:yes stop_codon:yes gene_type:complete
MGLKDDLRIAFEENLSSAGEISDVAQLITDTYKTSVESSKDLLGNTWSGVNYPVIKKAIEAQLQLSLNTKSFLQFTLIELGLVAGWSSAKLDLVAIPAPGMSIVNSGSVIISTPVGTLPLIIETSEYDNIVNNFYNMFTLHAKTLTFNYIGLALVGIPPPPIAIPVTSLLIK